MIGTALIGAWIAQVGFWILLIVGVAYGELGKKWVGAMVALWLAGYVGLPRISMFGGLLITSYVAVLDIVLVFKVFKGDIRIG